MGTYSLVPPPGSNVCVNPVTVGAEGYFCKSRFFGLES